MAWRLSSPLLPTQLLPAPDTRQMLHLPSRQILQCPWHKRKHLPCRTSADGSYSLRASSSSSSSPASSSRPSFPKTRLYVSGLSFRTTQESLRNAFENYGNLLEVKLVMDKIANRPRGFAFLRYSTEEESQKAIQGMHGKFLDGRVVFVEVAKPRPANRQSIKQSTP